MKKTRPSPSIFHLKTSSSDVIRLILHHLTECGLHESVRALRKESGIGFNAIPAISTGVGDSYNLTKLCQAGDWGAILEIIHQLDGNSEVLRRKGLQEIVSDVHEMSILELAAMSHGQASASSENNCFDLARAALRICSSSTVILEEKCIEIEQKLNALLALRSNNHSSKMPADYYGQNGISKQKRRNEIAAKFVDAAIPVAPTGRLVTLIQQATKWQAFTGQLSMLDRVQEEEIDDVNEQGEQNKACGVIEKIEKKKKRKRDTLAFNLILGEPDLNLMMKHQGKDHSTTNLLNPNPSLPAEKIPSKELGKIKFGKRTEAGCATFLPDGSGIITGSSDGESSTLMKYDAPIPTNFCFRFY